MDNDILFLITSVLIKHINNKNYNFFLYWSRARWDNIFRSDYDIWVLGPDKLDVKIYLDILNEFENIPALIDFTDFATVSEDFKKQAMKDVIYLNK